MAEKRPAGAPAALSWPALTFHDIKESSAIVRWQTAEVTLPEGLKSLQAHLREFPKPWGEARKLDIDQKSGELAIDGLNPTGTYQVKIVLELDDGSKQETKVSAFDTQAAGCVPKDEEGKKDKEKGCMLM